MKTVKPITYIRDSQSVLCHEISCTVLLSDTMINENFPKKSEIHKSILHRDPYLPRNVPYTSCRVDNNQIVTLYNDLAKSQYSCFLDTLSETKCFC